MTKYDLTDFERIVNKETTIEEIANKYSVSRKSIICAMNKHGYHTQKKRILIKAPYGSHLVSSIQECADELKLSRDSIKRALKGKRVATLEDMNIELEVYYGEEEATTRIS